MKFSHALAALAIVAMCGCKAGTPGKTENAVTNEVKHEVTIGGKDVKNPIAYTADVAKKAANTSSTIAKSAMDSMDRARVFRLPGRWTPQWLISQ